MTQEHDERDQQDPYPSDQQFGTAAAEDQEKVDRGAGPEELQSDDPPRAGTKAEPEGEG